MSQDLSRFDAPFFQITQQEAMAMGTMSPSYHLYRCHQQTIFMLT